MSRGHLELPDAVELGERRVGEIGQQPALDHRPAGDPSQGEALPADFRIHSVSRSLIPGFIMPVFRPPPSRLTAALLTLPLRSAAGVFAQDVIGRSFLRLPLLGRGLLPLAPFRRLFLRRLRLPTLL